MHIDFLLNVFQKHKNKVAIIHNDQVTLYKSVLEQINYWQQQLLHDKIPPGAVVGLEGDFAPDSIALFFALIQHQCIITPLLNTTPVKQQEKNLNIAQAEFLFQFDDKNKFNCTSLPNLADHQYIHQIRELKTPGLILFTSGSSGTPKAAVHNFALLLEKFKVLRPPYKMVNILGWDHWGGLNTMLHILSNGGTVFTLKNRMPDYVCSLIEKYEIEVLPASPTFLNLLIWNESYKTYDLSSLKVISYGAEPMSESTLVQLGQIFPNVKLQQTYGSIEWGVARSKSKNSNSLWVKIGGNDFQWRVVDGILEIKTFSTMLGYLNAKNPFTEDGWYHTGDAVEVQGDYLKILGRKSDIINIGGEKVFPAEVENVIQTMDNVLDVMVYKEKNPITGHIVCAKICLQKAEDKKLFKKRLKNYCQERLATYKIPIRITITTDYQLTNRFKKIRSIL